MAPQRNERALRECAPRRAPEFKPDRDLRVRPEVCRWWSGPQRGFYGTFIAEVEEYDPDPERWSTHRKSDFIDFVGDFAATFSSDGVTDLWVVTAEPDENEWRGRASMMQFYDE